MAQRPNAQGRRRPLAPPTEDLRDPAHGEHVERCAICGLPEGRYRLYPGLFVYLRFSMPLIVCGKCVEEHALRQRIDPLQLEDVA